MFRQSATSKASQSQPYELLDVLPSYFQAAADVESVKDYTYAIQQLYTATYDYGEALKRALSLSTIDAAVAVGWYRITLKESELTSVANSITYGSGLVYGQGAVYGQINSSRYAWTLPTELIEIGCVQDRILSPTVVLDSGWFSVSGGSIVFRRNPFEMMTPTQIGSDRVIYLWCKNVLLDKKLPFYRYGDILGVEHTATDFYVESLRRLWELALQGVTFEATARTITAATGLTYCEGDETVELTTTDDDYALVVTDKRIYRFHKEAQLLVAAGDVLQRGQALADTLRIIDLSGGVERNWSLLQDLPSLTISGDTNSTGQPLSFVNTEEAWQYIGANDVRCTVMGPSAEAFWDGVKTRGLATTTLASRIGMTGPSTTSAVNPMKLVLEILGPNTVLIRVRGEHALELSPGLFKRLPSLLPDSTNYIFWQQLPAATDTIELDNFVDTITVVPAVYATDTMSTSGYDLSYTDYAPLVTAS